MPGSASSTTIRLSRLIPATVALLVGVWTYSAAQPPPDHTAQTAIVSQDQDPQQKGKGKGKGGGASGVYKDQVTPHWFHDNTRFWYVNKVRGGAKEFIVVDAGAGQRGPAFDHAKLAAGLSKAAGRHYQADKLPFDEI